MTTSMFIRSLWPFWLATVAFEWFGIGPNAGVGWRVLASIQSLFGLPLFVGFRIARSGGQTRHAAIGAMTLSVCALVISLPWLVVTRGSEAGAALLEAVAMIHLPVQAGFGTLGGLWGRRGTSEQGRNWIHAHDYTGATLVPKLLFLASGWQLWVAYQATKIGGQFLATVVPHAVVAMIISAAAEVLRRRHAGKVQRSRDRVAADLLNKIVAGVPFPQFYLFLRPFSLTSSLTRLNSSPVISEALSGSSRPERWQFEEALANALRHDGLFVGLGRPGEAIGAGTLTTNDKLWRRDVMLLCTNCSRVLLTNSRRGARNALGS